MIFLLDTNVLSETMKPRPAESVAAWLRARPLRTLFTASFGCAEILAGIAVLPAGRRRRELEGAATEIFGQDFEGRILPFDEGAAMAYAALLALLLSALVIALSSGRLLVEPTIRLPSFSR